jgi:hypothetical protein
LVLIAHRRHGVAARAPIVDELPRQQGAREFRRSRAGRREGSSLKLDSRGAGRWAGQQRRSVSTTARRFRPRARDGLDLDVAAQPQLAEAGDGLLEGRHARGSSARGVSATSRSTPVVRFSESSCITIGTPSAVSLMSVSTQVAPRRRASRNDSSVFSGE